MSGTRNTRVHTSEDTGLPGRPSTRGWPRRPNISGLPGRMAIFQKPSAMPRASSTGRDEVVVADRGAADGDDDVGVLGLGEVGVEALARVAGDAEQAGLGARRFGERGHAQVIGGDDLAGARASAPAAPARRRSRGWRRAGGGARAACRGPWRPRAATSRGPEAAAGGEQRLALAEIEAAAADVAACRCVPSRTVTLVAVARGVLLDDDGIGAGGQRRAGEDAHGLSRGRRCRRRDDRRRPRRSRRAWRAACATSAARTA